MKEIFNAAKQRCHEFFQDTAQAILKRDKQTYRRNILIAVCTMLSAIVLIGLLIALLWKALGTLLGKVFMVPMVLFILGLSYKMNLEDSRKARQAEREADKLEVWAERAYEYVRDSMFYVVQAIADRIKVVKPNVPNDIEMGNRFFRQGNYIIFQFYVQLWETLDKAKFEQKLTDTLNRMHRDHRLVGIPPDLIEVNHRYYCPLLVLDVEPYDDGYTIQVVFADEETVPLVDRAKQRNRKAPSKTLYDDEP